MIALLKLILCCIYFFIIPYNAYAYLDPGTGSIILQTLAFLLAAGLAFFTNFWLKIKNFFQNLFKKKSKILKDQEEKKD